MILILMICHLPAGEPGKLVVQVPVLVKTDVPAPKQAEGVNSFLPYLLFYSGLQGIG